MKKTAKHPHSPGRKVRSSARAKKTNTISFQARSNEIHDSLDNAIKKIESGEINAESAKATLEKIKVVEALLRAASRELEDWLKRRKL